MAFNSTPLSADPCIPTRKLAALVPTRYRRVLNLPMLTSADTTPRAPRQVVLRHHAPASGQDYFAGGSADKNRPIRREQSRSARNRASGTTGWHERVGCGFGTDGKHRRDVQRCCGSGDSGSGAPCIRSESGGWGRNVEAFGIALPLPHVYRSVRDDGSDGKGCEVGGSHVPGSDGCVQGPVVLGALRVMSALAVGVVA